MQELQQPNLNNYPAKTACTARIISFSIPCPVGNPYPLPSSNRHYPHHIMANCANCGTQGTQHCAGCLEAPEYQPGDSTSVSYCSRDCQKEHWPSHKSHCIAMHQRRKLLRTARVLKAALLTYREIFYDIPLTKIDFQDGVLRLHQSP
ncbi:zinc finger MYND domain-containing protein [Aspergillus lucknowensis]|uniref:MYND-type domain-containing protein n=1 Tax=Aspergillus lucknowensis TaxID=176173 RepID=A0ABR4M4T1_9EURO